MNYLRSLITRIPHDSKDAFLMEIYNENLLRAIFAAIIVIVSETVLVIFLRDKIFCTDLIVYCIIAFNVLFFPVLCIVYKKNNASGTFLKKTVSLSYIFGLLLLYCALAVLPQDRLASINTYIMAIFGIAAFMYIQPVESFILFFSVYMGFFVVLPFYQRDGDIVTILRLNALIMNVFAWILSRLVFRMKVLSFTDKKIIEQKNTILNEMVIRDPMTSLLNHENAFKKLSEEIRKANRIGYPLSIAMVDIDNFKHINDRYGHQAGDEVIVHVANLLVESCRNTDIICRYGGEEYMLILPDTATEEAKHLAERIRMRVETAEFINGVCVTVSGGISQYRGESIKELIYRADQQLYKAKYNGKNQFSAAEGNEDFLGNPT